MAIVKQKVNPTYNFYHPEVHKDVVTNAQKKGVLGWTDENNIRAATPNGKAIYIGIENNDHLSPKDHQSAALTLHNRSKRIREALQLGKIQDQDKPLVQQELLDIEKQKEAHTEAAKAPVTTTQKPAMAKSDPLGRLLKIVRGKTSLQPQT